jgi:hypothetical protein
MNSQWSANQYSIVAAGQRMRVCPLHLVCSDPENGPGEHLDWFDGHPSPIGPSMDKQVEWKVVPGFPDYEVSEHGELRRGAKLLKPERTHGNGRKRYSLSRDGRQFRFKASQLVALAFIGPKPFDGAEVCHDDGFEHNNHFTNLRYGTSASNGNDVTKHRLQRRSLSALPMTRGDQITLEAAKFLR